MNLTVRTEFSAACCFDLFEEQERALRRRSVVILIPDPSSDFQVQNDFVENSRWKNPWSVEIWQSKKYWNAHDWVRSSAHENEYILVQGNEGNETTRAFIEKFYSSKHMNDGRSSPTICILNIETDSNAVQVKTAERQCSLFDSSSVSWNSNPLHVAGVESAPFAYYDVGRGVWKGIDISLITTVAAKLIKPMFVHVPDAPEPGPQSLGLKAIRYFRNRGARIVN